MSEGTLEQRFGEIKAKVADGSYDLFQASIEARKIGCSFGQYVNEVIDSWGGVPPKREELPAS